MKKHQHLFKLDRIFFVGILLGFLAAFFIVRAATLGPSLLRFPASFPVFKTPYEGAWRLNEVICGEKVLSANRMDEIRYYFTGHHVVTHANVRDPALQANGPICMDEKLLGLRDMDQGLMKMEVLRAFSFCLDKNMQRFVVEREKDPSVGSTIAYRASQVGDRTLVLKRTVSSWEDTNSECKAGQEETMHLVRDD